LTAPISPARKDSAGFSVPTMFNYRELDPEQLEFVAVAALEEIETGERLIFEVDHRSIVLFNIAGTFYAIDDLCTHDGGPVGEGEVEEHAIECPRHGARFDLESGKALNLPAVVDIAAYPVRVEADQILIGLPREDKPV
jgi:3-phenylpropionate/trans-cinnamate dioxygenase ferredoxin subunit